MKLIGFLFGITVCSVCILKCEVTANPLKKRDDEPKTSEGPEGSNQMSLINQRSLSILDASSPKKKIHSQEDCSMEEENRAGPTWHQGKEAAVRPQGANGKSEAEPEAEPSQHEPAPEPEIEPEGAQSEPGSKHKPSSSSSEETEVIIELKEKEYIEGQGNEQINFEKAGHKEMLTEKLLTDPNFAKLISTIADCADDKDVEYESSSGDIEPKSWHRPGHWTNKYSATNDTDTDNDDPDLI